MKTTAFIALAAIFSIAGFVPRLSAQDTPYEFQKSYEIRAYSAASASDPWSVAGQWHYTGPAWRGMIDIHTDGTFSRAGDAQAGKWKLGAAEDNFTLILSWKNSPQDTVALIGPTLFHADTARGEIIIRRLDVVSQAAPQQPDIPHSGKKSDFRGEQIAF